MSSDSDGRELLAHLVWYLLVGLLVLVTTSVALRQRSAVSRSQVFFFFQPAAGSFSPLLTSSGVSSEGNDAIGGRYGYVTVQPDFAFPSEAVPSIDLLNFALVLPDDHS